LDPDVLERAVHLHAVLDQDSGAVLGEWAVDTKTNEINAFGPLLDRLDITGAIIAADALHDQRAHAGYLSGRGAHDMFIAKGNQPSLHRQLASMPWKHVRPADTTTSTGHGHVGDVSLICCSRRERGKACPGTAGPYWLGAARGSVPSGDEPVRD
jgi:predicted transposase YbfD/YdcC